MVAHEAIAASPVAGTPQRDLMQALLISRYGYIIGDSEDPTSFDPRNTSTGERTLVLGYKGGWFWYDPDDSTTSHDGSTTIVTTDGGRYKTDSFDRLVFSVLDKDVSTPPDENDSPPVAEGDAYLVPSGATGDWSTHEDDIAVYTARGWQFITPTTGRFVFIEDEGKYYHFSAGGTWTEGFGNTPPPDNTVPLSSTINFGYFVRVENQTTDTPPGSPSVGDAYIIGDSPTGDWVGKSNQVAICEVAGEFVIYNPPEGMRAFDKSDKTDYQFRNSSWSTASGNFKITTQYYTSNATWSKPTDLIAVRVHCVGGGQGGGPGAGDGGDSSFGSQVVAPGGGSGTSAVGDVTVGGQANISGVGGSAPPPFGGAGGSDGTSPKQGKLYGGGGGHDGGAGGDGGDYASSWIVEDDLAANVAVTVGSGGSDGGSGVVGAQGVVVVEEYIAV